MKIAIELDNEHYERIMRLEEGVTVYPTSLALYEAIKNGKPLTEILSADYINNYIKQKIDYLENLASIETNEGRWREEEKYLYAISILEEIVEYIETNGGENNEVND
jgi:hypothetical protein